MLLLVWILPPAPRFLHYGGFSFRVYIAFHQPISQDKCHDAPEKVLPDSIYTPTQLHCIWPKCTLRECMPQHQFMIEKETACTGSSQPGAELSFVLGFNPLISLPCHTSSHWSILGMSESIGWCFARDHVKISHEVRGWSVLADVNIIQWSWSRWCLVCKNISRCVWL